MVEMLGVLAIIGVLSIGGLVAFRQAMDKKTANEILYDVSLAVSEINMKSYQDLTENSALSSLGIQSAFTISYGPVSGETKFYVKVTNTLAGVCKNLVKMPPKYTQLISVNKESFEQSTEADCANDNTVAFIFNIPIDLSDNESSSDGSSDTCKKVNCGAHGSCVNGGCICTDGYVGAFCEEASNCPARQTPFCGMYNADGTCAGSSCRFGECTPQSFPIYGKDNNWGICCSSTQTGYCSAYGTDGKCSKATCAFKICSQQSFSVQGGQGVCCSSDEAPMCYEYNTNGVCKNAQCSQTQCTQQPFPILGGYGACCASTETAYCNTKNEDGSCAFAACCSSADKIFQLDAQTKSCCEYGTISGPDANGFQTCVE